MIQQGTQKSTQNIRESENPKSGFISQNMNEISRAGSSVRYECLTCTSNVLDDFEGWLLKTHTRRYAKDLIRYTRKYHYVLSNPRGISQISVLSRDQKRMVMSALANLSKYLGRYEHWRSLVKTYGLRWEKKVGLDIVLDIMNTNLQDCWIWLKQVLDRIPKRARRGNSYRIQHYIGFKDSRRIYQYHKISKSLTEKLEVMEVMEVNLWK